MPFDVRIQEMGRRYKEASYEPELMVGLEWNMVDPKANLRIHTTGTVAITGGKLESYIFIDSSTIKPRIGKLLP